MPPWQNMPGYVTDDDEIDLLVTAAQDERADALDEILSQSDEFTSYFLNLMMARPTSFPATTRVLFLAAQIGAFMAMNFKAQFSRPRPSQLCPALLPPIAVPGHPSYPSGHSTQAHLMALCLNDVLDVLLPPQTLKWSTDLLALAERIARNREIAGLHYPSDSWGGLQLATNINNYLNNLGTPNFYSDAITAAQGEWQ